MIQYGTHVDIDVNDYCIGRDLHFNIDNCGFRCSLLQTMEEDWLKFNEDLQKVTGAYIKFKTNNNYIEIKADKHYLEVSMSETMNSNSFIHIITSIPNNLNEMVKCIINDFIHINKK